MEAVFVCLGHPNTRKQKFLSKLIGYDYPIVYKVGIENQVSDSL